MYYPKNQKDYADRLKEKGFSRISVLTHRDDRDKIQALAKELREVRQNKTRY